MRAGFESPWGIESIDTKEYSPRRPIYTAGGKSEKSPQPEPRLHFAFLSHPHTMEGRLNVLERKDVIRKAEVVEEIKRLREKSVKAR